MKFSNTEVNGYLMKRIEKVKFYHKSNWHEKYFDLDFEKETITFCTKGKEKKTKEIDLKIVHWCEEIWKAPED